ncbi:MAG: hypothetical protein Q8Q39_02150 [bacterium]|nr:hypothetical protein [bacterium]
MRILIVGLGTIGEPLAKLFLEFKDRLGVEEVIVHKNSPEREYVGLLKRFQRRGAKIAVFKERHEAFVNLFRQANMSMPDYAFEDALDRADVVIDCTAEKIGRKLKEQYYGKFAGSAKRFIAQGSEKGFGKPYAFDINDAALNHADDQFIQVVSCNTHQILCILQTLARAGYAEIVKARFDIFRRASDISQTSSTVGVEISPPVHPLYGSHQGEDAVRVLRTIGAGYLDIHTRASKTNNPFMHVVDFNLTLERPTTVSNIENCFRANPLTPVTYWTTNNEVFSQGREWGHFGRILNQTVVCVPSLEVIGDGHEVHGTCFTPQDGNSLLSSVAATLFFRNPKTYRQEMFRYFGPLLKDFEEV